jgi:hypothetical protein
MQQLCEARSLWEQSQGPAESAGVTRSGLDFSLWEILAEVELGEVEPAQEVRRETAGGAFREPAPDRCTDSPSGLVAVT